MTRGQRIISTGFEVMKQKSQATFASMGRLAESTGRLAKNLALIGVGAIGGLSVLSGLVSVLGPEFAKLGVEFFKLGRIVGTELKDAFGSAVDSFGEFVAFLGGGSPLAELVKDVGILVGASGIAMIVTKLLGLGKLNPIIIPITLAYTLKKLIEDPIKDIAKKGLKTVGVGDQKSSLLSDVIGNFITNVGLGTTAGYVAGGVLGELGSGAGAGLGAIGGVLYTTYETIRDVFGGKYDASNPNVIYNISIDSYFNDVDSTGRT